MYKHFFNVLSFFFIYFKKIGTIKKNRYNREKNNSNWNLVTYWPVVISKPWLLDSITGWGVVTLFLCTRFYYFLSYKSLFLLKSIGTKFVEIGLADLFESSFNRRFIRES